MLSTLECLLGSACASSSNVMSHVSTVQQENVKLALPIKGGCSAHYKQLGACAHAGEPVAGERGPQGGGCPGGRLLPAGAVPGAAHERRAGVRAAGLRGHA